MTHPLLPEYLVREGVKARRKPEKRLEDNRDLEKRGSRGDKMKWGRAKGGGRQTKVAGWGGRRVPQRTTAMEDEDCTGGSSLSSLPEVGVGEAGGREIPKEAV